MNVVVNGLMTNYLKAGNGRRVIICLHGWGDQASTFLELAKSLSTNFTVLAVDLPGFGGTQEPSKPWGVDEYANFVAAWLAKIGQKHIYAMIGHSNGGAIIISLLSRGGAKPKKVVLLASSGIRDVDKLRRLVLKSGAKIAKLPLQLIPKSARDRVRGKVYKTIGSDYLLSPELEPSYRLIISQDMQAAATKIKEPTLLIYGTKDKTTPVKYGQLFKDAIPHSKLEIIDAGHMLHHHQPELVASLVGDFLK